MLEITFINKLVNNIVGIMSVMWDAENAVSLPIINLT